MMSGRQASSSSSRRGGAGEITVGDFRVGDGIGKGSFATVYKGHHKVSDDPFEPIYSCCLLRRKAILLMICWDNLICSMHVGHSEIHH